MRGVSLSALFYTQKEEGMSKVFCPLSSLLLVRDPSFWRGLWVNESPFKGDFISHIQSLMHQISRKKPKRALLLHENRGYFLAGFLACLHAGVEIVLPQANTPGHIEDILEPEDIILKGSGRLKDFSDISINIDPPEMQKEIHMLNSLQPELAKVTLYTSGSTGAAKKVTKSLIQLENEIHELERLWGADRNQRVFYSTVPHSHIYGLLFSLLWPVCAGDKIQARTLGLWEEFVSDLQENDVIISSASHLGRIPNGITFKEKRVNVFSSGGVLNFSAVSHISSLTGRLPMEVYGSTETGGIAYRSQETESPPWKFFKNVKGRANQEGLLQVLSPYLPSLDFFQTHDRVTILEDGSFLLHGRADRIVKVEGKRVCLVQLEKHLLNLEEISETFVNVVDAKSRDTLGAVIVLSSIGMERLKNEGKKSLIHAFDDALAKYFDRVVLPRKWRFVEKLPLSDTGKISREEALKILEGPDMI